MSLAGSHLPPPACLLHYLGCLQDNKRGRKRHTAHMRRAPQPGRAQAKQPNEEIRRSIPPVFLGTEWGCWPRAGWDSFPRTWSLTPEKEGPLVGVPNSAGTTATPTTGVAITVNAGTLAARNTLCIDTTLFPRK